MVLNSTSGSPEDWEPEVWIGNEATGGNMVTSEKTAGTKLFTAWFPTVLAVVERCVSLRDLQVSATEPFLGSSFW